MSDGRWHEAAELGARGHYARAWRLLDDLRNVTPAMASLASSMLGSHLRQIGAVDDAQLADARALDEAVDAESRADAGIGLAADAIAAGDPEGAPAWLVAAEEDAMQHWRTRTRWHWVNAEMSLALGRPLPPRSALDHALLAIAACEGHSARHLAKSRIIADAVRGAGGAANVGGDLLAAADVARAEQLVTLQWPLALVATDLHKGQIAAPDLVAAAARLQAEGAAAVRAVAEGLPERYRSAWLSGPAAALLVSDGE